MAFDFQTYTRQFQLLALQSNLSNEEIDCLLIYAKHLADQNMPIIFDQEHLSQLVGVEYYYLLGVTNSQAKYYKHYLLPKKTGGFRDIMEPFPTLKFVQTWILRHILYANNSLVAPNAKAFIPKVGLRDNAKFHKGKNIVVNIDIVDFFGNINFKMVFDLFSQLGYNKPVAIMLANLCTLQGSLPQGAPTSPMISNMVFNPVDDIIFDYCKPRKIMYTRYADDLSFSGDFNVYELLNFLNTCLKMFHFKINGKKTKICTKGRRQSVTNIVVNEKIQTTKEYRKSIRQCAYYIQKYGLESHVQRYNAKNETFWNAETYLNHIRGKVIYALYINPKDMEMKKYKEYFFELANSIASNTINDKISSE